MPLWGAGAAKSITKSGVHLDDELESMYMYMYMHVYMCGGTEMHM